MKDFNPLTYAAILREMLGGLWWPAVALGGVVVLVWCVALLRRRFAGDGLRRAVYPAAFLGALAGVATALLLPTWTQTGMASFGAPIDYIVDIAGGVAVGIGVAIACMPLAALLRGPR
jgi:hypothetical protein